MGIDITKDIVTQVKERYEKSAQDKRLFIEDILLNQQYIRGRQNSFFDSKGAFYQDRLEASGEETIESFNRMLPIFNKRIQILSRNMPDVKTRPVSNQINIDQKSKITNALIDKIKRDNNFKAKYGSFIKKIETYSMAFYKIIYDYRIGDLQKLEIKRNLDSGKKRKMYNEDNAKLIVKMIKSGGIDIYVGSSLEFYQENIRSSSLEENEYIIHAKAYHIDDIKKAFGVKVNAEQIDSLTKQSTGKGVSSARFNNDTQTDINLKNHAMVIEYYERPTKNNPNGRKIIIAGDKLIYQDKLPYRCGINGTFDYNFVIAQQNPQEGLIYGENVYTQLRPIQRRYNSNRNLIKQFIKRKAIGTIMSPQDALEDTGVITNKLGNIIEYNPMYGEPHELKMGDLPSDIWNEINQCEIEFIDISGVHTTSGQTQSNIRSGEQMQILNQSDENSVGVTVGSIIKAHEELFVKILRIMKEKSEYLPVEIYENGMDRLIVTPNNILEDIYIENAGVIGLTEQQQVAKINAAVQLGILNKEGMNQYGSEHIDLILRESGMGHIISQLDTDAKYQKEYINRENNKLIFSGVIINVNDFDDDEVHIKYHNRLLMSSEFEEKIMMGGKGDQIKKAIDNHISQHRQRLQKAQMLNRILAAEQKQA